MTMHENQAFSEAARILGAYKLSKRYFRDFLVLGLWLWYCIEITLQPSCILEPYNKSGPSLG